MKGQSLIEVLIAFGVSVLIGVALITASLATQKAAQGARNQSQATKLGQEYMEKIRAIRDTSGYGSTPFPSGPGSSSTPACYRLNASSFTSSDPTTWQMTSISCPASPFASADSISVDKTTFYRWITLSEVVSGTPDTTKEKVAVDVSWTEGTNSRNVHTESIFSAWCPGSITGSSVSNCQ